MVFDKNAVKVSLLNRKRGSMVQEKRPFHEVVDRILDTSIDEITSGDEYLRRDRCQHVLVLLNVLKWSKMPATAAHEMATRRGDWPKKLRETRLGYLAESAEATLADLRAREDEKSAAILQPTAPNVDG